MLVLLRLRASNAAVRTGVCFAPKVLRGFTKIKVFLQQRSFVRQSQTKNPDSGEQLFFKLVSEKQVIKRFDGKESPDLNPDDKDFDPDPGGRMSPHDRCSVRNLLAF